MTPDKVILGIDPGTRILGWGVIEVTNQKTRFVEMGVVDMRRLTDPYEKLKMIFQEVSSLIGRFKPSDLAVEAPFYGKNVQSMLVLGRAQGAAITAALSCDLPIFEYAPKKVKMAITGRGGASKEQVATLLVNMLKIKESPGFLDATDGVAVAYCHFIECSHPLLSKSGSTNWNEYIKQHPGRVK